MRLTTSLSYLEMVVNNNDKIHFIMFLFLMLISTVKQFRWYCGRFKA